MITTIQIERGLKEKLDALKIHRRETYNELISRLIGGDFSGEMDVESLISTLEVLSDSEMMVGIKEALQEDSGKTLESVEKELGL